MSVKVIAEIHPIRRTRIKITTAPKQISEIIKDLNTGFSISQARVCRNGEIVKDFSITANDGDLLVIKFIPCGDNRQAGSAMKFGGWALAIVGGMLIATGFGAGIGAALIGAGVGMLAGGTALLNINIPKMKDTEKPVNDPSIRGGKNQARPHGRIPVLLGRHRLYPDLAANSFTSIIGNQQYFTQLFCGGYKDCVIDINSFKLGETPLVKFSQTKDINAILACTDTVVKLEILQNGETSSLYPNCVHEEIINAPLQNQIEDSDGNKISGEIERTTPDNTDTINVDIFFYNGIGKYNDKGILETTSVKVYAYYKMNNEPYSLLGYFNGNSNIIYGNELKTKRYQITKSDLTPGKYTIKLVRITSDTTDSNTVDQVYVGSIRSIKSKDNDGNIVRPIRMERQKDLTIIALRVMATEKLNNVLDSFNYIATSKFPVYSGGGTGPLYWLNASETRNPAALLLYALQGRASQESVTPEDIDWQSFQDFYNWCEKHNYTCNAFLSESVTIAEIMKMIGGTSRADILRIDSKISVVQDIERPSHMGLFTPKNSISYSVTMMKADIPDAIALRYIDEESGYAQNEAQIYNTPDGNRGAEDPDKIQKVDLWGITDSVQARRIGMYNYACLKNRPFVHAIELDIEYLICNKGDWIQYAGDIALTGSVHGRITGLIYNDDICLGIRVDEPVKTDPAKQYAVRIRISDGTVLLKDIATVQQPNVIFFSEPFNKDEMPREGDLYAFGVRGYEVIDLIITDIQPQADFKATLTCVEYSPEIFGVDNPDFKLPEFVNRITPVSGAIDSGQVGPARWRLFITYHDGEEEPPHPEGAGHDGGWHYAQTLRSVWQSSKMAESADSGEWGAPVRIKNFRSDADVVPIYLTLSPQTKIFDCDSNGNILTGLLPFTSQASLYKWNFKLPVVAGIQRFPGSDGNLFDPMLGDFIPTEKGVVYSIENAPQGVSVDENGVITVSENAALDGEHSVIVHAEYEGSVYSTVLFIQVKKRVGETHYLGTVETLPRNSPDIFIIKGPVQGQVRALQGSYVLAVASGTVGEHTWKAGWVYQWSGVAWEERVPENYSNLYINCFKDGLEAPELTQDMGWFGAVFARLLIVQQAFIETLEAQLLKVSGAIYGGDRFNKFGDEVYFNKSGWYLGADGIFKAAGGRFSGDIYATGGYFENAAAVNLSITGGSIKIGPLEVSEEMTMNSPTESFSGNTRIIDFVNKYLSDANMTTSLVMYNNSTYGSADLYSIVFIKEWKSESSGMSGANYLWYIAEFYTSSGKIRVETRVRSGENPDWNNDKIGQSVVIHGGGAGKTFLLKDIPYKDPQVKGKLFTYALDNILRISQG